MLYIYTTLGSVLLIVGEYLVWRHRIIKINDLTARSMGVPVSPNAK